MEPSGELALAAEFPTPDRERWRELVDGVLKKSGAPFESLLSTTYDGIPIAPLYTAEDVAPPSGFPGVAPFVRGGRPDGAVDGGWLVRQLHAHPDPAVAKNAVMGDLLNGVGSLWLKVGSAGLPAAALDEVLADVYLDLAPVVVDGGAEFTEAGRALLKVFDERPLLPSEVRGNLGADPIGVLARTGAAADLGALLDLVGRSRKLFPELRSVVVDGLPFHEAGGSDAQELGASLAAGVAYLRALTDAGLSVAEAAAQLEFRYSASADQFLTIAKFRAARRLWARVTEVAGATAPQLQHAVTSTAMMTRRDPWVNMLRTTTACFGAGLGGADAVTVLPFDAAIGLPDDFARRIARNTQAVLLEESRLAGVIDPAGGSWYVERLTDDLAHAAWAWFQEVERAGGIVAALGSGLVADRLAATWAARSANLADRTDAITGVSEFPNLAEKPVARPAAPVDPTGGLPVVRYAQAYESLRDRSDAHLAAHGARPTVFLATLGPVAAHTARASFAANLLQAGGIDTPNAGPTKTVEDVVAKFRESGARIACLCGSETSYGDLAAPVVEALRAAGAERILLAGKKSDASIDEFVFTGCPALDVLDHTFAALEVA
ncbi:methylmalonyl-CoA mutase subunit beta [Umezawaea endophytica]|uniref:Methylmalonyl-CoA mutase subunit beta n=1 Tax=Umezawaea endophytica TaxID=1654476 RepID=A0A9X2VWQ3_9PSEU|nr:methylmalonyl-CoA mutase subunit beta [Umezawaea endophytica]MCS7484311.1 methylmalonyl-CoA mutase subunit beta [Umezawaea endophytica]